MICAGGVDLPTDARVDCEPCHEGLYRPDGSARAPSCRARPARWLRRADCAAVGRRSGLCRECPAGKFSTGRLREKCRVCPAGKEALRRARFNAWDAWPAEFGTGCVGRCGSPGWRLRSHLVDSGFHHIAPAVSWLQLSLNLSGQVPPPLRHSSAVPTPAPLPGQC